MIAVRMEKSPTITFKAVRGFDFGDPASSNFMIEDVAHLLATHRERACRVTCQLRFARHILVPYECSGATYCDGVILRPPLGHATPR